MSIYTITLKRELLGSGSSEQEQGQSSAAGEANFSAGREADQKLSQRGERKRQRSPADGDEDKPGAPSEPPHRAIDGSDKSPAEASACDFEQSCLSDADWLDCICGALTRRLEQQQQQGRIDVVAARGQLEDEEAKENKQQAGGQSSLSHSSECLQVRREQLIRLQARANEIVHSVNVTLEVSADLANVPNEIVWYKNQRQLTSSERPVFYIAKQRKRQDTTSEQQQQRRKSIKRTKSQQKRQSTSAQGYSIEETTTFVEEQIIETREEEAAGGSKSKAQEADKAELVEKCRQVTSDKGSKLTIFNLQDEDYGQYTCRLIDLEGNQLNIHTQLKQQQQEEESNKLQQHTTADKSSKSIAKKLFSKLNNNMDEVIEVKEGDFNIELGIQILPEINDDEELMSEEEKAEFIANTTINWFKDDVKLDQNDPDVQRLFQFTYDQNEGFHRLIVRKATKETEGVYTCLVENESGTSSCSTQLVVGPGNKPKLTSRLQDVTVYVGQSLEFRIKSTGLPPIDSCQWFKDDELLIELSSRQESCRSKHNERISMSRSEETSQEGEKILIFKLNIDQLKLDDSGRLKCRINNEYGYDESDCYVKVLQEIIEEHEEIEETIEETLSLGGGKKSTQREESTTEILEEREEQQRERVEEREVKRQKHDDQEDVQMKIISESEGGRAPEFRRRLQDKKVILVEEETSTTEQTEELIVSTRRDQWSDSRDSLKIQWFVNGREIHTTPGSAARRRSSAIFSTMTDEATIEHEIVNFYDETSDEIFHKLILKRSRGAPTPPAAGYSCKATNDFGSSETKTQIGWTKKPRFLRRLEDTETSVGETIVLKVTVEEDQQQEDASSNRDLRFSRDGKVIYSSKSDGDKREFVTSSGSRIKVRNYEETVETTTEETTTTTTRYQRRYSRPQTTKRRGRTYELTIENVQIDQQGQWECQATNEAGSAECRADVEVFAEPKLVTDLPEAVRIPPGKEIRLHVEASGSPMPVYSWFKDEIGIAEEEDRVFTETKTTTKTTTATTKSRRSSVTSLRSEDGVSISGETLIIRGARPEDAGLYSCKVENRLGQVESRTCKMTIIGHGDDLKGAPKIIKDFQRNQCFTLDEGESVILKVLAEGQPKPRQYWYKDTEEIVERVSRFEVEQDGQEYKLKIKKSEVTDSGKYKVVLRNEFGETTSQTVEVKVNKLSEEERRDSQRRPSAPSILVDSQDKVVGLGSNVSFDVQVAGHPKPLITWYKNGRRMTESGDGRISFVEEETIVTTTITEIEEDETTGKTEQRKETTTTHKLVIRDVTESDEAIYSLKAENDLGSTKSALSSLSVDKRKAAVDETTKTTQTKQKDEEMVEEETTTTTSTTTTVTKTKDEQEDESEEMEQRKSSSKTRRTEEVDEDEFESDGEGGKKRKTIRTTRTTTRTTTTTTTSEEEEAEEAERRRRQKQIEEEQQEQESKSKNKRRTVEEVEEEIEEEEEERVKRRTRKTDEREDIVEDETEVVDEIKRRRSTTAMDVDEVEEEEILEEEEEEELEETRRRRRSQSKQARDKTQKDHAKQRRDSSRRDSEVEETIEDELIETTKKTRQRPRPQIISAPKEVIAGLGSSPEVEVEFEEEIITEEETIEEVITKITWLKDGQEIDERLLRDKHIELIEKSSSQPNRKKQILRINSLRSSDAGDYKLRVENPQGKAETSPIKVAIDRTMRPGQRPSITPADVVPPSEQEAPEIISVPEEIVSGMGSKPELVVEAKGKPEPELSWFKDGQPLTEQPEFKSGHVEVVKVPTDQPDVVKEALKINDFRPADVAAYHVKAENPAGEVESEPTNVRIDRTMAPTDEPIVSGVEKGPTEETEKPRAQPQQRRPSSGQIAPSIVSVPEEVAAGRGGSPVIEAEVAGKPQPQLTWLKDGQPISDRDLRTGHVEIVDVPTDRPDTVKQALKINDLRPTDVAEYQVKAENPAGQVESSPTKVKLDRSMSSQDVPVVKGLQPQVGQADDLSAPGAPSAPKIVSAPEEVVAGPGSSPQIEAQVSGSPKPELTWLKDGQPISDRDLRTGHVEIVDMPTDKPDEVKQALKINDFRPTDAAAYSVKAENPLGEVESQPTKVKLDRRMSSQEAPIVKGLDEKRPEMAEDLAPKHAPEIVAMPKEVTAGPGSSPQLVAEVEGTPKPELTWLKDGQPIKDRDLRSGHIEVVDLPTDKPDAVKQALKINDMRPTDAGEYSVKAENPLGETESQPTEVKLDRRMSSRDQPKLVDRLPEELKEATTKPFVDEGPATQQAAPTIVSIPDEIVAGRGAAPQIEAEVAGSPKPELTWLKDGQPISDRDLRTGHVEVVDLPTERPDTVKQALKINDMRTTDAAAYSVKAENPLGQVESKPANVKLDRKMSSQDVPVVTGLEEPKPDRSGELARPEDLKDQVAPTIISVPEEVVAGRGSSPVFEAEVAGKPKPEISWFKDGQPLTEQPEFKSGHVEVVDLPTDQPDVVRQGLKINDFKPADAAAYHVKAENPAGEVESEPTNVRLDRTMAPTDEPIVSGVEKKPQQPTDFEAQRRPSGQSAPKIISAPDEVVAGPGSSPQIEAQVSGSPQPQLTWLKDGQPISDRDLRTGHVEVVDMPTEKPDEVKQALKINDFRPTDVAAYSVKAENPLGEVESQPTKVKLDRRMSSHETPIVKGLDEERPRVAQDLVPAEEAPKRAPAVVAMPKEVTAGPGSSPQLEAEVEGSPQPQLTWLKDGQPIKDRDLRSGHVEIVDLPTDKPDSVKQALKINDMRPTDAGEYSVKAENPLGETESHPTEVKLDRRMSSRDQPKVLSEQEGAPELGQVAPSIVCDLPEEIVAGLGSSPQIVAEASGQPKPQLSWYKDGQPISQEDLPAGGHLEVIDLPTEKPDSIKQALKINNLKPADVAAYHVKAENPLGECESQPTNLRIDRSMGPRDAPKVSGLADEGQEESVVPMEVEEAAQFKPQIVSQPQEIVAPLGSSPKLEVEVKAQPKARVEWLKDGEPIPARLIRDGHLQLVETATPVEGVVKQTLIVNDVRPSDVAAYTLKAENPLGQSESEPIKLKTDRSMSRSDEPKVIPKQPTTETTTAPTESMVAPTIVSVPEEVVAGPGSSPELVAEAAGTPAPQLSWFKDGQPLREQPEFKSGHVEVVDLPTDQPDAVKQALKINNLRPADVAAYHVKAENPAGEVESEPTNVRIDRSMAPTDEPIVSGVEKRPAEETDKPHRRPSGQSAPKIISAPEEVVAGPGSSPQIEAQVSGSPQPQLTWLKDGQPISDRDLRTGHVEVVDMPTDKPDEVKQALKINDFRPTDVAAYSVKAENPLGEVESQPTKVKLDRRMSSQEQPVVKGLDEKRPEGVEDLTPKRAPEVVSLPEEVVAGPGSSPQLVAEVEGTPKPELTWLKEGQPIKDRDLRSGHIEVVDLPTDKPDAVKQALKINDMRPTDAGEYSVKAENPLGEVESQPAKVKLDRRMSSQEQPVVKGVDSAAAPVTSEAPVLDSTSFAPTIESIPDEVVAGRGSSPLVQAIVAGKPAPKLSWFKDGQPVDTQDGHLEVVALPSDKPDTVKQALKINDLKPSDVAAYHVKAENPLGECESQPTNVRIDRKMSATEQPQVIGAKPDEDVEAQVQKPRIAQVPRNIKAPLDSNPILEVEVLGGPADKVEWFKDGRPVEEDRDLHVELENLPDGTQKLRINKMRPDDVGVYTVRATNPAGVAESGPIKLSTEVAEFKPEILNTTEEVSAGPGSHPQLEVDVRAAPQAEVTWYKDGKPLNERQLGVGHVTLVEEKSPYAPDAVKYVLRVDRLKPTDAATYHLVAHNPLGSADSKPIQLRLDRALEPDETPIVKKTIDDDDRLSLAKALGDDILAAALSDAFAPQILSMTDEVVAGVGSSPQLEAVVKAKPAPTAVNWFKDGQPISQADIDAGHLELVHEQLPDDTVRESLKINQLKPADVAAYHVQVENPLGQVESEPANVRLDRSMKPNDEPQVSKVEQPFSPEEAELSRAKPKQAPSIKRIPRTIVAPLGSNPVIEVEIAGEPKPEVVWMKDGRQVSDARGHIALVELPDGTHRLSFTNLKAVDQGDYAIVATNELGEIQSGPISLVIDQTMGPKDEPRVIDSNEQPAATSEQVPLRGFAPTIERVSDRVVGRVGGQAMVEVEVRAVPQADVTWLLDGQQIPLRLLDEGHIKVETIKTDDDEVVKYQLVIGSLKPSDAGVYQLVAENPFGSIKSPSIGVTIRASEDQITGDDETAAKPKRKLRAPTIKRAPKHVVAKEGTSPVLEVEVSGEPIPEIHWFRNGKRIERTDAHFTFDERPDEGVFRLVVNEVTKDDEATYTAVATNEAGSAESAPIELSVEAKPTRRRSSVAKGFAPQILSSTEEIVSGVGSSPLMEVVIRASPEAKVEWFKDGQPIHLDSPKDKRKYAIKQVQVDKETTKFVLEINNLKPTDVGAYHLRAENQFGCVETEPTNVRIDRGMDSTDAPVTTTTEQPFEQLDDVGAASVLPSDGVAAKPKRPIRAPTIKRMPRRVVAPLGSNPVIEVEISGEPKPEIIWFKNGKRLTEIKNRITFEETPQGIFRVCFTDVKITDQAEYSFIAQNEAGNIESGPIELLVDRSLPRSGSPFVQEETELPMPTVVANEDGPIQAPKILDLKDQEALPGQTVRLEAEVVGNPRPEIKWLKDGDEVELNIVNEVPGSNRHSLTLKNVSDLYDGTYSLEAKNVAGVARQDAKVKIVDQLTEAQPETPKEARFKPEPVSQTKRKSLDEPKEKPFIKKGLKFSQVNQGRTIKFEVQIDGKYDELIWMKDGEQINLPFDEVEEDMVSQPLTNEVDHLPDVDDDTSTLRGSDDELGDDLVSGKPKQLRKFPPRILRRPRNVVAGPGSRIAFEVQFEGQPLPEVRWFKHDQLIQSTNDGKVTIEQVGDDLVRLIIEDVQTEDVGTYFVVLENPYGTEKSLPVMLELDETMPASDDLANYYSTEAPGDLFTGAKLKRGRAPRILTRPRAVHAPKGSRVAFEVQVAGEPEPVVNWYRDGRIIKQTSDGHVVIEEYSQGCVRLVLTNITDQDVGQYHVVAENKLGSERTIPVSLTIDETSTSGPVDQVGEFEQITSSLDEELRRKRGGRPPRILLRPKQLVAPIGGQARLEVNVVGQSKPSIIWYKDGKRISVTETTTTTTETTRTTKERIRVEKVSEGYERLVIDDLTSEDAGRYSVSAENDFGVSMSQPVELIVRSEQEMRETKAATTTTTTTETTTSTTETTESFYERFVDDGSSTLFPGASPSLKRAPRFTIKPRNKRQPIGSKVDFEVKVSGEPKPDVVWYKNGRRIHTTADGRVRVEEFSDGGSKLIIEDLEETDHGVYAAEASNEWGKCRTDDVQLRVTQRTEVSERSETKQRGTTRVTTRTKKTRSHYTFSEERHGYVTLTLSDAQLEHDGDYKLIVRNKWGEASTQAPLVVIPKVEHRSTLGGDRAASAFDDTSTSDGRDSRARRTPFDELEDYGHELNRSIGVFGSESHYQSGEDTYLLQLRDTEFPLRLRKYLRFGARQSPSLRSNLMDAHWGAGARVTIRERRKFREVMDEEIDDEKSGRDLRPTPMRLQKEVGTCGYAAAQLEHLRVEAAERVARQSAEGGPNEANHVDMMPPFFREKLKDCVIEESASGQQEAVFFCLAAGEPKPDYTWFKNDVIITPDINRMFISELGGGSELRIRDPRLYDSGCYKCVARNVHGNVTSRARLRVASRPSRPEPPEYVSVTAREVFLQWRPPRDFDVNVADVLGYRLEMSQSSMGQDDHWTTIAADIGHEFYVVDDLTPGTSYSFRISARNKFGWSDSSYSAYVTTSRASDSGDQQARLVVPHEMRARQCVSEVCDVHTLRHCEDDKVTNLNYSIEQSPVKLNGSDGNERWQDAYALQAEIARGRFSIISKGVAKRQDAYNNDSDATGQEPPVQLVAMKFVPSSLSLAAQTKNEFDILRSLRHEKVVRLLMAYRDDDSFVFVMERLSGIDVLTYLSSFSQYNEDLVSRIIQQVMDAIEYLHFRGMCLLELQPDNVVMTNGRTAALKLVDFSSARFVPKSGARVPANASQNIEYCPPEVIANHEVSTASDVWCIGVLTYVLLSGFSPFKGDTEDETRENVRLGRYKYDHIYANCTPEVTRFLINVFKKHSSKRPTIEQLFENKWLLPNEFMIRKRQHATFRTDKIVAFADEFHRLKSNQDSHENNVEKLNQFADVIGRSK